ncbi:MAG TPA: phage terminase large subunit [Gemmatimonadaceae bacterium]|nr:phage terminase large subunit [Gemmatimonadaceae bacterium]
MTVAVARATWEDVKAEKAKRRLLPFVELMWPVVEPRAPFVNNWHIGAICEHLEAVTLGQISDLLINIPPGSMKSYLVSVFWMPWEWIRHPHYRYLCGSYDEGLAVRDNRRSRDVIKSEPYQRYWPLPIREDQDTKTRYDNVKSGWRIGTSVGGKGTGEHPHRKIIDDPHNVRQSLSDVQRQEAITWFDLTMGSRGVALNAATVIVMQRLHERDLSGHVLETLGSFVHLCLPMRYEPKRMVETPLGWNDPRTVPGELLWPALFDEEKVSKLEEQLRASQGEYGVAGQLQQRPAPVGGGLFKRQWFELVHGIPQGAEWCRAWDKAGTHEGGDYTVGVLMAKAGGFYYIVDVVRAQLSSGQRNALIRQTARMDADRFGMGVKIRLEQEPGSGGKESAEISVRELAGYDVQAMRATGDKVTRARPFAAQAEAGNVKLFADLTWNRAFLDELSVFPAGSHDDQVDATSGAFNTLALGFTPHVMKIVGF